MGYESAPATRLLATHCAFCGRPLVDARSVECGVGPVCRKKYLVADGVSEASRRMGNALIYQVALHQKGPKVEQAIIKLEALGFAKVVERIRKRIRSRYITLNYADERLYLRLPFIGESFDRYLQAVRRIPGRKWEGRDNGDSFPKEQKAAVWRMLCELFPGREAIGPKGPFTIAA